MSEIGATVSNALEISMQQHLQVDANAGNANAAQPGKRKDYPYTPQQLSHIAWAYGSLQLESAQLNTTLKKFVIHTLADWQRQASNLSNISWCLTRVCDDNQDFLKKVAEVFEKAMGELNAVAVYRCAESYRHLAGEVGMRVMTAVARETVKKLGEFQGRSLMKIVDALYL